MKFLCPSCKAKYQIADEKVAGRSVRMKCRKCGQEIRVSSADAIPSSSAPPPGDEESMGIAGSQVSLPNVLENPLPSVVEKPVPVVAEKPAPVAAKPSAVADKAGTADKSLSNAVEKPNAAEKAPKPALAGRGPMKSVGLTPGLGAVRPAPPSATNASAAGSGFSAGASASSTVPGGSATATPSPLGARPAARPLGAGGAGRPSTVSKPLNRANNAAPLEKSGPALAENAAAKAPLDKLKAAGAERSKAAEKPASPEKPAERAVPEKPEPATSLAAKPAAPSAAKKPAPAKAEIKPDLRVKHPVVPVEEEFGDEEQTRIADGGSLAVASAVAGALAGAFNAAVAAPSHQISDPLTMPGDEWFVGINGVPVGPIRLSELRQKASTGAITKESLVWRDGFEEWRPLKSFPELVAIVEESLSSVQASALPFVAAQRPRASGDALSDPFGATVPQPQVSTPAAVTGAAVVTDDLDIPGLRSTRRTGRAAWIAVVVALFFGISVGFVIFSRKPTEIVRYVEVPAKGAETAERAPATPNEAIPETEIPGRDVKPSGKGPGTSGKAQTGTPKPEDSASKLASGLRGLGAGVTGGPNTPGGSSAPSGASGQLESSQVQQVVARYTPSVKRSCWQPALDTRDKDAGSSARVVVSIQVGASGSVQNASTSGDPRGYRGLANCIVGRVRGWQFPASGGSTTVNVPFVFVAQ